MDRARFSRIAHQDHAFFSPIGSAKVDRVLDLMDLAPGERVLDVGCGRAELLLRLIERRGVAGVGVDRDAETLAQARSIAEGRVPRGSLTLHAVDAADFQAVDGSFGAALCVGASHPYGGCHPALAALSSLVRPGGYVLMGEGYWKRPPDPAYLAFLGAQPDEMTDHAGNVAAGREAGLTFLYAAVSSEGDWDHYEGLYLHGIERWATAHPDDPDRTAFIERIRAWHDAYLRYGRETLGFALYLFRTPEGSPDAP